MLAFSDGNCKKIKHHLQSVITVFVSRGKPFNHVSLYFKEFKNLFSLNSILLIKDIIRINLNVASQPAFTYSKLTIEIPERRHWRRSGVFIVNFEHISHFVLVCILLTLNI